MGIPCADTAGIPRHFRFVCNKTTHFANPCVIRFFLRSLPRERLPRVNLRFDEWKTR